MHPRRRFLQVLLPATVLSAAAAASHAQQQEPLPRPVTPRDLEPRLAEPKARDLLKLNQKEIKKAVERLVQLTDEIKKEVDQTDSVEILPVGLVRKAEEVEKLGKKLKNLLKG